MKDSERDWSAEYAVLKSHFDRAQRLADTGSWEWDVVTNGLTWSDHIYRIFGLSPQAFQPSYPAFLERVHPDDRALVEHAVQRAIEGAEGYDIDHRVVRLDGSVRIVREQGQVEFDPGGWALRMLGAVQDVTDLRAAESAFRRGAALLTFTLGISTQAILAVDEGRRIIGFSAGAEAMFGYQAKDAVGLNLDALIPERLRETYHPHFVSTISSEESGAIGRDRPAVIFLRADREEFRAEVALAKVEGLDGDTFVAILREPDGAPPATSEIEAPAGV